MHSLLKPLTLVLLGMALALFCFSLIALLGLDPAYAGRLAWRAAFSGAPVPVPAPAVFPAAFGQLRCHLVGVLTAPDGGMTFA